MENLKTLNRNRIKLVKADEQKAELITQRYSLPFLVSRVLVSRGFGVEDIPDFIEPKISNLLPNPSVLKDMDKAASKIAEHIIAGKPVGIIGDYDVDGATSSALLRKFLEDCGIKVFPHIPDRDEGYGPSRLAFDKFSSLGVELVISADCGTTAFEPLAYAAEKNIAVIVLDHHEAETKLPKAFAVVNPKRLDEENQVPHLEYLAAVGVVFLSLVAINRGLREKGFYKNRAEPNLLSYLDLVALGTVCDVVPLQGLNRAFVKQGLKVVAARSNLGLKALMDKGGVNETPNTFHLGFVLGPRINACGRVGDSSLVSHNLLCAKDNVTAEQLAETLNNFNSQRKEIENYVLLSAIEQLESSHQEYPMAFVVGKDWHQGVIGIVAGKLKERYNLPAFVMSIEGGSIKGSSRSIPGIDLGSLIIAAKEKGLLTSGGGHVMAAGFSLNEDKLNDFRTFIGEHIKNKIGEEDIEPIIEADSHLNLNAVNVDLADKLELLEPYGAGNPEPKFIIKGVHVKKTSVVGSGHVRCFLSSSGASGVKALAFRAADTELGKALLNPVNEMFTLIGYLRKDNWQGRSSVQFIIEDGIKES